MYKYEKDGKTKYLELWNKNQYFDGYCSREHLKKAIIIGLPIKYTTYNLIMSDEYVNLIGMHGIDKKVPFIYPEPLKRRDLVKIIGNNYGIEIYLLPGQIYGIDCLCPPEIRGCIVDKNLSYFGCFDEIVYFDDYGENFPRWEKLYDKLIDKALDYIYNKNKEYFDNIEKQIRNKMNFLDWI